MSTYLCWAPRAAKPDRGFLSILGPVRAEIVATLIALPRSPSATTALARRSHDRRQLGADVRSSGSWSNDIFAGCAQLSGRALRDGNALQAPTLELRSGITYPSCRGRGRHAEHRFKAWWPARSDRLLDRRPNPGTTRGNRNCGDGGVTEEPDDPSPPPSNSGDGRPAASVS